MFEVQALAISLQISPGFGSKILDNFFLSWCRKMWNKTFSILLNTGVCVTFHSLLSPPSYHSSSVYMLSCLSSAKKIFIPSSFQSFSLCLFIHWKTNVFMWTECICRIVCWSCSRRILPLIHLAIIYLFSLFAHISFIIMLLSGNI